MILRRSIEEVEQYSKTITGYCRYLLKEGYDPNWTLEVYRKGKIHDPDVIVENIGKAAELMVDETSTPRFVKYRPPPQDRMPSETPGKPPGSLK